MDTMSEDLQKFYKEARILVLAGGFSEDLTQGINFLSPDGKDPAYIALAYSYKKMRQQ